MFPPKNDKGGAGYAPPSFTPQQINYKPEPSEVVADYTGVGKRNPGNELSAYDIAIQNKIKVQKEYKTLETMLKEQGSDWRTGGLSTSEASSIRSKMDSLKGSLAEAEATEAAERKKVQKIIDGYYDELGISNPKDLSFAIEDRFGNKIPNEGLIFEKADEFARKHGASGNVANIMAAEMILRTKQNILQPEFEKEFNKLASENTDPNSLVPTGSANRDSRVTADKLAPEGWGKLNVNKGDKVMFKVAAHINDGANAVNTVVNGQWQSFLSKKKAEYKPVIDDMVARYSKFKSDIHMSLMEDLQNEAQASIDKYRSELEAQVKSGQIMVGSANMRMKKYVEDTYSALQQKIKSKDFLNQVDEVFSQVHGPEMQKELDAIDQKWKAEVGEKKTKLDGVRERAIRELNSIGDQAVKQLGNAANAEMMNLANKAYMNVLEREGKKMSKQVEDAYRKSLDNIKSGFFLSSIGDMASWFGESFFANVGNMMRSKAMALNAAGYDGAFTDWLKETGGSLYSKNATFTPELKSWNFISPALIGNSMGQIAYSLPSILGSAMLTRMGIPVGGSYTFALLQTADNAAINSGDSYWEWLKQNPGDISGAQTAAKKVFALHMLDLPLNAVIGKFWFGKNKSLMGLGEVVSSEYITESYESATQSAVLNPITKNFVKDAWNYWKGKQAQTEGVMAAFGVLTTGGATMAHSAAADAIFGKAKPDIQFLAGLIYDRTADYARASFVGLDADYGREKMAWISSAINRVGEAVADAKALGLDKEKTLLYVEMSERINDEKAKAERVKNPVMKEQILAGVKTMEQELLKIADGTTKPTVIRMAGTSIAMTPEDAEQMLDDPAIQATLGDGSTQVKSEDEKVNKKVEEAMVNAASMQNGDIAITENEQKNEEGSSAQRQRQEGQEGRQDVLSAQATDSKEETGSQAETVPTSIQTATPVSNEQQAADRKAFNQKFNDDLSVANSLTPEGKKKKYDAMTKRLIEAKNQGVIDDNEFNSKYEGLAKAYQKLADANPEYREAAKVAKNKAKEALMNTRVKVTAFAKGESRSVTVDDPNSIDENAFTGVKRKVVKDVKNVIKAAGGLVKATTGNKMSVTMHQDDSAFSDAVVAAGGAKQDAEGGKGFYLGKNGEIHLNMARVTSETMLHEGFHPILDYIEKNAPEKIDELYTQLGSTPEGKRFIAANKAAYSGSVTQKKEAITDFIANVADGRVLVDATNFQRVKNMVMGLLKKLGFDVDTKIIVDMKDAEDLKNLAKMITEKFGRGEQVSGADIAFNPNNLHTVDNTGIQMSKSKEVTDVDRRIAEKVFREDKKELAKYPEAVVPKVQLDKDGKIKVEVKEGEEGERIVAPMYSGTPYDLRNGAAKYVAKSESVAIEKLSDKIVEDYNNNKDRADIAAGIGWYGNMRNWFQKNFGANIELFGQLLAATSARTPVFENFNQAVDAMRNLAQGKYDELLKDYDAYITSIDNMSRDELFASWRKQYPKKRPGEFNENEYRIYLINRYDKVPLRSNGKKFNANSPKVLQALYGNWLSQTSGPKTKNFAGNLTGRSYDATIDVWAARYLRRVIFAPKLTKWRVLPQFEGGVEFSILTPKKNLGVSVADGKAGVTVASDSDTLKTGDTIVSVNGKPIKSGDRLGRLLSKIGVGNTATVSYLPKGKKEAATVDITVGEQAAGDMTGDYPFAEAVMRRAAEKLGINADDLQAFLWYLEKDVWDKNGWTNTTGKKKASFEEGAATIDSERYQIGVTTFRDAGSFDREAFEKERLNLQREIGSVPGIISSRVSASDGEYKGSDGVIVEPTFDIEFTVDKGSNVDSVISAVKDLQAKYNQESVLISKVVDATHENARPIMEIGLANPVSNSEIVDDIKKILYNLGVNGFTTARDSKGRILGIRSQFVPEFSGDSIEDGVKTFLNALNVINEKYGSNKEVSYITTGSVDTQVNFNSNGQDSQVQQNDGTGDGQSDFQGQFSRDTPRRDQGDNVNSSQAAVSDGGRYGQDGRVGQESANRSLSPQFSKAAPNGKPSKLNDAQWEQVRTPEFKAWFGDWENDPDNASKVVDENGEPQINYHITNRRIDFDEFKRTSINSSEYFFFTPDVKFLDTVFNSENSEDGRIFPVFLNIRNILDTAKMPVKYEDRFMKSHWPKLSSTENNWAIAESRTVSDIVKEDGFDGLAVYESGFRNYAVTRSNQIKSATANVGTFDPNDNRIQFSKNVDSVADAISANKKPADIVKDGDNYRVVGGIIDLKIAAIEADKKADVTVPMTIPFLPNEIVSSHLARSPQDAEAIVRNGFDESKVNSDSPVPGIYFSSEDWSSMDRFGRKKGDEVFATIKNEGLLYFDSPNSFSEYLSEKGLPSRGEVLTSEQVNKLRREGVNGIILREDFASQSRNEFIVLNKDIITNVSKTPSKVTPLPSSFHNEKSIADAYVRYKEAGVSNEFTKKVEDFIGESNLQFSKNLGSQMDESQKIPKQQQKMTFRQLFAAIYSREKKTLDAVREMQKEVSKYIQGIGVDLAPDLVAEIVSQVADLARPDITVEEIDQVLGAIDDAVKIQTNVNYQKAKTSFAQQLIEKMLAMDDVAKAIKEVQETVVQYFKDNGLDMKKSGIVNVMKQLTQLAEAGESSGTLFDVINSIDSLIAEQRKYNEIQEAKKVTAKFKKFVKGSRFLSIDHRGKMNEILAKVKALNPNLMAVVGVDMQEFTDTLKAIMEQYGGKQTVRDLTMTNLEYMSSKLDAVSKDVADYLDAKDLLRYNAERDAAQRRYDRVMKRAAKLDNLVAKAGGMRMLMEENPEFWFPAYNEWREAREDADALATLEKKMAASAGKGVSSDKIKAIAKLQIERLQQFVTDNADALDGYFKDLAKRIGSLDLGLTRDEDAKMLVALVNNMINDGNTQGVQRFLAYQDARAEAKRLEENPIRTRNVNVKSAHGFSSLLMALTFNREDAAKFRQLFLGVMNAANTVQRMMYGFVKADGKGVIEEVYDMARKMASKPLSNARVGVFQFLNQAAERPATQATQYTLGQLEQRVGMQEFLTPDGVVSKQADFEARLDHLIGSTVERQYNEAAANQKAGGITAKSRMDNALQTADALKQMGLIDGYAINKDQYGNSTIEVQRKGDVSLDGLYDQLDANEKELYNYIREKFADPEFLERMKQVSEGLHNMPFNSIENYAPMIARRFKTADSKATDMISEIGDMNFRGEGGRKVGVRPSDRFMQRGVLANPEEFYYSTDAIGNFLSGYYEANLAIEGGEKLKSLSYLLNSKEFQDLLNGVYNKAIDGKDIRFEMNDVNKSQYNEMLERFADVLRETATPPFLSKDPRGWVAKSLEYILGGVTATYLQTSDQVLKQLMPNIAAGMAAVGVPETLMATRVVLHYAVGGTAEERSKFTEFLKNFEGDFRSPMGEAAFDELNQLMNDYGKIYKAALAATRFKDTWTPARIGKYIFKQSDKAAYAINVISAYIGAEVKAGRLESAWAFDTDAMDNVNEQSVADALNMAEMLNNASKSSERAPFTKMRVEDRSFGDKFWRNMMFLKGFSLNSFMGFRNNILIAADPSGRATAQEKKEASMRALSYAVQIGTFNLIKAYVINQGFNILGAVLVKNIFGMGDKETEEQRKKRYAKMASQFVFTSIADASIGWWPSVIEGMAKGSANWLWGVNKENMLEYYKSHPNMAEFFLGTTVPSNAKFDDKSTKKLLKNTILDSRYNPYFDGGGGSVGSAEVFLDLGKSFMEAFKTRTNKAYTAEQNAALDKLDIASALALITGQGDAMKVIYGMERTIRRQAENNKPKGRGSSNPFKQMQNELRKAMKIDMGMKIKGL